MTKAELLPLLEALGGVFNPVFAKMAEQAKSAEKRLAESEHRLKQLELEKAKTFLDWYRGVHQAGNSYERGLLVTADGSLWTALKDTSERPGASSDWKLVVKKGKDAPAR